MENQWWDKPATAETIPKLSPNWHAEHPRDWFWLLLDFNIIHQELIDSQTSACGLSVNCQVRPCLLFLPAHLFTLHLPLPSLFSQTVWPRGIGWVRWICRWLSTSTASLRSVVNGWDTVYSALNIGALTLHERSGYREAAPLSSSQQQPPRTSAANSYNSYYQYCLV